MKKFFLWVLSRAAFQAAVISLSQCSLAGSHQPDLTHRLKERINEMKGNQ